MKNESEVGTAGPQVPFSEQCNFCFGRAVWVLLQITSDAHRRAPMHLCAGCARKTISLTEWRQEVVE